MSRRKSIPKLVDDSFVIDDERINTSITLRWVLDTIDLDSFNVFYPSFHARFERKIADVVISFFLIF